MKNKPYFSAILFLFFAIFYIINFSSPIFAQTKDKDKDVRTMIKLLDYIAKDYSAAVQEGKILDKGEFDEMTDFAEKCLSLHKDLTPVIQNKNFNAVEQTLQKLKTSIAKKESVENVSKIANEAKNKILALGILKISPEKYPSLKNGEKIFDNTCVGCHGKIGKGDGPAGKGLDPSPTNFHEADISSLHAFNVIKLGIEGTGMVSYAHLSEEEIWDLSFYILSLKHEPDSSLKKLPKNLVLDSLSRWNDKELKEFLQKNELKTNIAQIRHFQPSVQNPLDVALENMNLSFEEYKKGDLSQAEKLSLNAYLEGIELVENLLKVSSPGLVSDIEKNMLAYRKALQTKNNLEVENNYKILIDQIQKSQKILEAKDYSFAFIYGSSLSILLREALESLLIILLILSILRPMNIPKSISAVHLGWTSAIGIGFVSWFFVDKLINISGASRELMEGFGAILAVFVLLYTGIWLHSHAEVSKWTSFIKEKINKISETRSMIGLFVFSFIVVFREVFEVVLFLSSLKVNNPVVADSAIFWAVLTSTILMSIISFVFLKYTKKLPLTQFFTWASYMISVLAVILVGKGISAFQEAGIIPINPIYFLPKIELLGFYPNIQTILSQLLVLGIVFYFQRKNKKK